MLMRRVGRPGLLGLAARTAVVAGTASVTAGAINRRQQQRTQQQQDAQAYEQSQAQQPPAPAPQPEASSDLLAQISQLSDLHAAGALTDDEFAAAKAKLLGT